MDARDVGRRSCSPTRRPRARRRRRRGSSSSSRGSSTPSDSSTCFSRRNRHSKRQESTSRCRSRSPRRFERRYRDRRRLTSFSRPGSSRSDSRYGDTFAGAQETRGIRHLDSGKAAEAAKPRRIAPNASALNSILLSTARSRDRMDERERARAQKKLESLNRTARTSTM